MKAYDFIVVGGGIVGLSTAMHLAMQQRGARILLIEKESVCGQHQTGRNSGVIHSGIYYKPGSYKAKFARAGAASMVAFCREHGISHDVCGKVIIATDENELPALERLYQRGMQNELPVRSISPEQLREVEPHAQCIRAIQVPTTGITNYLEVTRKYQDIFQQAGGEASFGSPVVDIAAASNGYTVQTTSGEHECRYLINCAGLNSDRIAILAGEQPDAKIVPFRGEYFELVAERRFLVNTLIYPVPNPDFPFLGVHFTKMIDGSVHAGPNAVLALKREGYKKTDFSLRDFTDTMGYAGFWKLAWKNLGEGMKEIYRSLSKAAFLQSLQRMIPDVQESDLIPCKAGVRAQALMADGGLVDDFLFIQGARALHVCNAPSPAATASLEIGRSIAKRIPQAAQRTTVSI